MSKRSLDTLLLKKQGVCGMLDLNKTECFITVHSAMASIEEAQGKIK